MAGGFGSTTLRAATSNAGSGVSSIAMNVITTNNVAGDLWKVKIGCFNSDTATITQITDTRGNVYTRRKRQAAGGQFVEIWTCKSLGHVGATVTITIEFSTTVNTHVRLDIFADPPATWEVADHNGTNTSGTTHSCGSVTAAAAELLTTMSSVSNAFSVNTSAADYTVNTSSRSHAQWRISTGPLTVDGAWTSADSETVTSCHVVFREPSAAPSGRINALVGFGGGLIGSPRGLVG